MKKNLILANIQDAIPWNVSVFTGGLILSILTQNIWFWGIAVSILLFFLVWKVLCRQHANEPVALSRADLLKALAQAQNELRWAKKEIEEIRNRQENQEEDVNPLYEKVLKLVGANLTAYDNARGRVSAEATIEYLRANLVMLGKNFQAESTEGFTAKDWEDTYESMNEFNRSRRN